MTAPASRSSHIITVTPEVFIDGRGSIPFVFDASCSCGRWRDSNAWLWVALSIQEHYDQAGLLNDKGRVADPRLAASDEDES